MSRPVFDTNVFVEFEQVIAEEDIAKTALSAVVLYELTATTIDRSKWQQYTKWRKYFENAKLFLVPTAEDWWESSRIVSRIRHGEKSTAKGKTPKHPFAQRLQNDILIARTAYARKFFVVTSNVKDYEKIRQFLEVDFVSAAEYFSSDQ